MSSAWHFGIFRKGELLSLSTSSLSFVLNHRDGTGSERDDDEEATGTLLRTGKPRWGGGGGKLGLSRRDRRCHCISHLELSASVRILILGDTNTCIAAFSNVKTKQTSETKMESQVSVKPAT